MRALNASLAICLLVPLSSLSAQQRLPVRTGTQVRLTSPEAELERKKGTVIAVRRDTLVLRHVERQPSGRTGWTNVSVDTGIPLISVTRLDVRRGKRSCGRDGAIVGGIIGAGVGAVARVAFENLCMIGKCTGPSASEQLEAAVIGGFLGGLPLALIGGGIGSLIRIDRWEEVPLDRLRVSIAPQRDGRFALGLSVWF